MLARILAVERRHASRYRLQLPVLFSWADDQHTRIQAGFTRDISVQGLFVTCAVVPPLRTAVNLELLLPTVRPDNAIRAEGHVVRTCGSNSGKGIAIAAKLYVDSSLGEIVVYRPIELSRLLEFKSRRLS